MLDIVDRPDIRRDALQASNRAGEGAARHAVTLDEISGPPPVTRRFDHQELVGQGGYGLPHLLPVVAVAVVRVSDHRAVVGEKVELNHIGLSMGLIGAEPDRAEETGQEGRIYLPFELRWMESFIDELAHTAEIDPVKFRLRNLRDPRAIAVIQAAAEKAAWGSPMNENCGRGIAFARYKNNAAYCAVVVEVRVDRESGEIKLERAVLVGESGQAVNPDGISNQLEGGFIQSASMTLKEEVHYDAKGIKSVDWEAYPILTFSEAPKIETLILNRPGAPFLGSGEASQGPTPAAIANAVFDAVGIRCRQVPFLPARVKALLAAKA